MTQSDITTPAQIEAFRDLVQSKGWQMYRELVMQEIASDFEEHITKALDVPDSGVALDRMRQVAAVRKAGLRWLKLPQERLQSLTEQAKRHDETTTRDSRRPVGL